MDKSNEETESRINLTGQELINIIEASINRAMLSRDQLAKSNRVVIADIEVHSNIESLETCKNIAGEIIKKNHKFITNRKNKLLLDRLGSYID